jgi:hypothetical protein
MLLVEGENADGVTVEDSTFGITTDEDAATLSAADQVISAILGTREGATEAGHALASTGVTWTDPVDATALRDALATRKVENVMLVSSFMAAAALAQTVGCTVGEAHTALLFLEPGTATLAVIDSADGSITDVHKELMSGVHGIAELAGMVAGLEALETQPQSVFIVGAGVDVATIKSQLEAATTFPITAAEEPETALAWGAALASANAPLFASSTAALAYAQDPGTGAIDPYAVSPGYLVTPDVPLGTSIGEADLAYSAVPDEDADAHTVTQPAMSDDVIAGEQHQRGPLVLVGSILAVLFVAAVLSLEVALALGIRPSVALLPRPLQNLIIQNPPPAHTNVDVPQANHLDAPAVAPRPAKAPVLAAAPIPAPAAPPLPAAPPPVPVVAPPAVVPLPIPVRVPAPVHIPVRAPSPPPVHVPQPPIGMPDPPPVHQPPPVHLPPPVQPPPRGGLPGFPGLPGLGIPGWPIPIGPHAGNPGGFGGPPSGDPGGFGEPPRGGNPGGFGGPPSGDPGGFGEPPRGGNPGGFGGPPSGNPGGFGGPPGGFGGSSGSPGGFGGGPGGFGGGPGGFGGGPGDFGGGPGGFGGGDHGGFGGGNDGGFGGGGFGGGGFGGGGFGGGGHSGGFGGGGHSGGGHH